MYIFLIIFVKDSISKPLGLQTTNETSRHFFQDILLVAVLQPRLAMQAAQPETASHTSGPQAHTSEHIARLHNSHTLKYEQGTLEEDFKPSKRCLKSFSQGGTLGINELLLDLWQLVLGGFWNQLFGNQA